MNNTDLDEHIRRMAECLRRFPEKVDADCRLTRAAFTHRKGAPCILFKDAASNQDGTIGLPFKAWFHSWVESIGAKMEYTVKARTTCGYRDREFCIRFVSAAHNI